MAVEMDITYTGELQCEAVHGPSGQKLTTEAPVDNGGKGRFFSPTDLVGAALGTCIVTVMGILAQRRGWDLRGTRVHVAKEMVAIPLRRVGALNVRITLPQGQRWSAEDRQRLEHAAHTCPVTQSLHPDVKVSVEFIYPP
jgi:putative redox protein